MHLPSFAHARIHCTRKHNVNVKMVLSDLPICQSLSSSCCMQSTFRLLCQTWCLPKLITSRAHAAQPAGSIVTLQLSRLSVWLSICHSLGRPRNKSVAWQLARMAGSVCLPPCYKKKPSDTSTIDDRGTVPLAQAQYHEWSMCILRNRQLNCLGQKFVTILTLCPISELHDPVDS